MGYMTERRCGEITITALLLSNLERFRKGMLSERAGITWVYLHQQRTVSAAIFFKSSEVFSCF